MCVLDSFESTRLIMDRVVLVWINKINNAPLTRFARSGCVDLDQQV